MNQRLRDYVNKQIDEAALFVLKNLPINLSTDQVYEGLVSDEHVLRLFTEASQHLTPSSTHKRVDVLYNDTIVKVNLRLWPTEKHPAFLLPKFGFVITQQSELGRALALPVRVATDWEMLKRTWERMALHVDDVQMLALLFPWLGEMFYNYQVVLSTAPLKAERLTIAREVKLIQLGNVPYRFPRLTSKLNDVCRSGKTLFSQFRMLEATHKLDASNHPLTVERLGLTMPEWFERHLGEVIEDWTEEEEERKAK